MPLFGSRTLAPRSLIVRTSCNQSRMICFTALRCSSSRGTGQAASHSPRSEIAPHCAPLSESFPQRFLEVFESWPGTWNS
jgi:hypothetical protein